MVHLSLKGFLKYLASSVCLIASLQSVSAATLQGVEGGVLVNKGNGFELAGSGTQLQPGDQVLVRAGGKANIVEQLKVTRRAVSLGADTMVIECMAVLPQNQRLPTDRAPASHKPAGH